jgi:two-component system alkaline phosphatase synthesis response regulator PhoP
MPKKKILLIDDDVKFVDAIKVILDGAGYEVDVAYDGKEGGVKMMESRPDLIILDVMMPNKDGFQLCAEIKKDPKWESVPVIMLTAVGENIPRTRYSVSDGLSLDAEDYIPKPVEPAVLLGRIKELLP